MMRVTAVQTGAVQSALESAHRRAQAQPPSDLLSETSPLAGASSAVFTEWLLHHILRAGHLGHGWAQLSGSVSRRETHIGIPEPSKKAWLDEVL